MTLVKISFDLTTPYNAGLLNLSFLSCTWDMFWLSAYLRNPVGVALWRNETRQNQKNFFFKFESSYLKAISCTVSVTSNRPPILIVSGRRNEGRKIEAKMTQKRLPRPRNIFKVLIRCQRASALVNHLHIFMIWKIKKFRLNFCFDCWYPGSMVLEYFPYRRSWAQILTFLFPVWPEKIA